MKLQTPLLKLQVNEIYTALQGEGESLGKPAVFLRLAFCNLHCSFCDTPYAWHFQKDKTKHRVYDIKKEVKGWEIKKLAKKILKLNKDLLVITGGEPLIQKEQILELVKVLKKAKPSLKIEIETNGTIGIDKELAENVKVNVSPKLKNSGNELVIRYKPQILRELNKIEHTFKFVVVEGKDIKEIKKIIKDNNLTNIYLMAEGQTKSKQEKLSKEVSELALKNGWSFTPRLHILLYGTKRRV